MAELTPNVRGIVFHRPVVLATALAAFAVGGDYRLMRRKGHLRAAAAYLHFRCPGCRRRLRFLARQAGHSGECSRCGHGLVFSRADQSIE